MITAPVAPRMTILLIDDDEFGIEVLDDLIGHFEHVDRVCFLDPREALVWLTHNVPDVVITDFDMPHVNGLAVIEVTRGNPATEDVPLLMLTGSESPELRIAALEAGANDFLRKPFDPLEVRTRVRNMLALRQGQQSLKQRAAELTVRVDDAVRLIRERERETILRLSRAAEFSDEDTHAHLQRISQYASIICDGLGVGQPFTEALTLAAPMHDIGKIGIPPGILNKPGKLEAAEYDIVKTHTTIGHRILDGSSSPLLQTAAEIALSHHEKWNGEGYPQGLSGVQIPLTGRIVAVADVFDALTTSRPYKEAWAVDDALDFVRDQSGAHFDPQCATVFLEHRERLCRTHAQLADEKPPLVGRTLAGTL